MELWGFERREETAGGDFGLFWENGGGYVHGAGGAGGPGAVNDLPPAHAPAVALPDYTPPPGHEDIQAFDVKFDPRWDPKKLKGTNKVPTFWAYRGNFTNLDNDQGRLSSTEANEIINQLPYAVRQELDAMTEKHQAEDKKNGTKTTFPVDPESFFYVKNNKTGEVVDYSWTELQTLAYNHDPVSDDLKNSAREAKETSERLKKQLAQLKLMMENIDTGTLEGLRAFFTIFRTAMRDVANMMEGSIKKIAFSGQEKMTGSHERLSGLFRKMPQKMDKSTAGLNADIEQERGYQQSVTNIIESAMSFARSIMTDAEGLDQGINSVIASIDRYLEGSFRNIGAA